MPRLLIVAHAPPGGAAALLDAVVEGATDDAIEEVDVVVSPALDAQAEDVRAADGVLLGTTENFGYMSGALKHFFDTTYPQCVEHTKSTPYALFVKAGHDGAGTIRAVEAIATGLKWRRVRPPLLVVGDVTEHHLEQAWELGATMAAGLSAGAL